MSSTNKTPNYALPQFIAQDKPTWLGDVNAAMLAIDTAMAANKTTAEAASTSAGQAVAQVADAVEKATDAKGDAAAALQSATNALAQAQQATNAATSATNTANTANTTATTAAGNASQALATANAASNLANQTSTDLTEFKHYFSTSIPSLDNLPSAMSINPATYTLLLYSEFNLTTEYQAAWKFNGEVVYAVNTWTYNLDDNLTVRFMPVDPATNTQTIMIKAKTPFPLDNAINITFASTLERYIRVTNANIQKARIAAPQTEIIIGRGIS